MVKIVIADDHPAMREAWHMVLELHEQIQVTAVCSSGREVIDVCRVLKPDLVLMDINMEPMNGFEAAELLLSHLPSIHIIGISIHADPSYAQKMLEIGGKGFVTKSSPAEEMIVAIREVTEGRKYICNEVNQKMN